MKKSILFSFVVLLSYSVYAQNHPNNLIEVHYDNDNAIGVGSPNKNLIIAAKLTYEMLSPYIAHNLYAIKVFINNPPVGDTGIVRIYAGGTYSNPGDLIYSSPPAHVDSNSWNTIYLDRPIPIPPSDLWIAFEAVSGPIGSHSWAGCDSGPNNPDGQYMYYSNGWYTLTFLGSALTYNWNIRALIEVITNVQYELANNRFELSQNYPNPFNPSTAITFSVSNESWVNIKVFNILGQEITTLFNSQISAGEHIINFNASYLPSGLYVYKMNSVTMNGVTFTSTKKMILQK
jgi:hypothetical protein